jgi:hypothetical protein
VSCSAAIGSFDESTATTTAFLEAMKSRDTRPDVCKLVYADALRRRPDRLHALMLARPGPRGRPDATAAHRKGGISRDSNLSSKSLSRAPTSGRRLY